MNIRKNFCGVINLDASEDIDTHWTCYLKEKKIIFVLDSYVEIPPKPLVQYIGIENFIYNDDRTQNFNSAICGHFCVKILYFPNEDLFNLDFLLMMISMC